MLISIILLTVFPNLAFAYIDPATLSYVFSLLVGFLTSLSIYFPLLNYTSHSVRGVNNGGYGIQNATQWSLHIKEFFTFIMPYSYGFGGQNYWGFLPFTDFPNYIGIFIWALVSIYFMQNNSQYIVLILFLFLVISLGYADFIGYKIK